VFFMSDQAQKSMVVIAAHTGDFVWRCAGAIALHAELGYRVRIICLSYGARGEAVGLYKDRSMTPEKARVIRKAEAIKAAGLLGAEVDFLDGDDYMLRTSEEMLDRTVAIMREVQVKVLLTHSPSDPGNLDHVTTHRFTLEARMAAQAMGRGGGEVIGSPQQYGLQQIGAPQVYCFEPHHSELCGYKPDTLLDISSVWEKKWAAIQCVESQPAMWNYYKNLAIQRGSTARGKVTYAEAYQKIFLSTVNELI
jgi:4-oxalomesaconate hydratase